MTRAVYNLLQDVKGEAYALLLEHALRYCDSFSLVIRESIDIDSSAEAVLNRLESALIRSEKRSEWPGTQLHDGMALVNTYRLSSQTVSELTESAEGLFSWTQPRLPEDPCFFRKDGEAWLVTIAHETDGYLVLSAEEKVILAEEIPTLSLGLNEEPREG